MPEHFNSWHNPYEAERERQAAGLMRPRCLTCREELSNEELAHHAAQHTPAGTSRCFVCLDEVAMLAHYEAITEPVESAVVLV